MMSALTTHYKTHHKLTAWTECLQKPAGLYCQIPAVQSIPGHYAYKSQLACTVRYLQCKASQAIAAAQMVITAPLWRRG